MVKTVMDVDKVETELGERQPFSVGYDRRDSHPVAPGRLGSAPGRTERDVRPPDVRSRTRQELGVHARPTAHGQRRHCRDITEAMQARRELLLQQPSIEARCTSRALGLPFCVGV